MQFSGSTWTLWWACVYVCGLLTVQRVNGELKDITLDFLQGTCRNQASTGQGAPKGLFLSHSRSRSFTVIPVSPPHTAAHTKAHPCIAHRHTHAAVYDQRGYLSLPNKASATADTSHFRQLGHNLRLNVYLMRLYVCNCVLLFYENPTE